MNSEKVEKVKIIAYYRLGLNPFKSVKYLTTYKKKELIKMCNDIYNNENDDKIDDEFNNIVCNDILDVIKDYTVYPVRQL